MLNLCSSSTISLIPDCNDAQFASLDAAPPRTGLLAVSFSLTEDGVYQRHEIVAAVRCRADYLLNASGEIITTGDDD